MNIINLYVNKRNLIQYNILNKKEYLLSEWINFLKKDTYLTSDLKEKLLEDYTQLFHWFFLMSKKIRISSKGYNLFLEKFKEDVGNFNEQFIEERLEEYKNFFDGKQHNLNSL